MLLIRVNEIQNIHHYNYGLFIAVMLHMVYLVNSLLSPSIYLFPLVIFCTIHIFFFLKKSKIVDMKLERTAQYYIQCEMECGC